MNSIGRVMAAIKGTSKDRIPLSLTLSLYGAKLTGCPLDEYYTKSDEYIEGQHKIAEIIKPDIIFSPFSLPIFGRAFGSIIKIYNDQAPNLVKPIVKNLEDVDSLDFNKAYESPEIEYFIQSVKGLSDRLGSEFVIAAIMASPYDLPVMLMGISEWMELLLSYPEKANKLIEKSSEFFVKVTNLMFEAGATVVVLPAAFVNPTIITENIARNILKSTNKPLQSVNGPVVMHSGGAKMIPFLKIYQNIESVKAFVVNYDDNLLEARDKLLEGQVIIGNLEGPQLNKMSIQEIRKKTQEICNYFGHDPNFIFGSSGADIPYHTPIENILVIKEELENYSGQ